MRKLLAILLVTILILPFIPVSGFSFEINPFSDFDKQRAENLELAVEDGVIINNTYKYAGTARMLLAAPAFDMSFLGERYIIKFKDSISYNKIYDIVNNNTYKLLTQSSERLFMMYIKDIDLFNMQYSDYIEYTELDKIRSLSYTPSDPLYNTQWASTDFNISVVWDYNSGSEDVVVAVLDSGVDRTHEDLAGSNILTGYDAITRKSGVSSDPLGHGTGVTGIIIAQHNELGVAGVAPDVTVLPIRVTSEKDQIYSADFIAGLRFAADSGADVINMSFGGIGMSNTEQNAIKYAADKGCILIAAAGNEGNSIENAGKYSYPASYDYVISVASINSNLEVSGFSQFNDRVDIAAPGESITILSVNGEAKYTTDSGTSYAAPYVSAIAALALSALDEGVKINSDAFLALLRNSAGMKIHNNYIGYGIINPHQVMATCNFPIVYGVYDDEVYFEPVSIYYNRGTALLNDNHIISGQKIELNGNHTLSVEDGTNTVMINFIIDTMQLKYSCPTGDTFYEPISITFSRGTATLNGYPYYSGKKIETSGQYKFVLTGPYGNKVEKNFTMLTDIPVLLGVEDGIVYTTPVKLRQIGEGNILLNGIQISDDTDTIISENGEYTVIISNYGLTNSRTIKFTINTDIAYNQNLAMANPKLLLDEQNSLIMSYGDNMKGIRLYDTTNFTESIKFIGLDYVVLDAILTDKYVILQHISSITLLDRSKLRGTENAVYTNISFTNPVRSILSVNNTIYTVTSSSLASILYSVNSENKTKNKIGQVNSNIHKAIYSSTTNRIYLWNTNGYEPLYFYNIASATISNYAFTQELSGNILCDNGYLFIAGHIYNETNLANTLAIRNIDQALLFKNSFIITQNIIYNAFDNTEYGSFKKAVSDIEVGSDNTVYIAFTDKTIEVCKNAENVFNKLKIKQSFRAINPVIQFIGNETSNSDFLSEWTVNSGFELIDWELVESTKNIYMIAKNDYNLYILDSNFNLLKSISLPNQPKAIATDNSKIYITFENSRLVYFIDAKTLSSASMNLTAAINTNHIEAANGFLYLLSGNTFYSVNSTTRTTNTITLSSEIISFTVNPSTSTLYFAFSGLEDYIELYNLNTLVKKATYPFVASSSLLFCDGTYLYSSNLVYNCNTMNFLYAMPGKINTSNGTSVLLDKGVFNHSTMNMSVSTSLFGINNCLLSHDNEVYVFISGGGIAKVKNPFKIPLGLTPEVSLSGIQISENVYKGNVTVNFNYGYGYLNGYPISNSTIIKDGGTHNIIVVMPLAVNSAVAFNINPVINGISISGGNTQLFINESKMLSIIYSPKGVSKVPVNFISDNDCIKVEQNGQITGMCEGTAIITAITSDGKFKSSITVTVLSSRISFNNTVFSLNNSGFILVDRAGIKVKAILDAVNVGNGSAVVYKDQKVLISTDALSTGCRLAILNVNNEEISSSYISVKGDIDGDSIISVSDFLSLKSELKSAALENEKFYAADINKNGVLSITDLVMLESHLLGKAPLSYIDQKTLQEKQGLISISEISTVHVGAEAVFQVTADTSECYGVNGVISYNSDIMEVKLASSALEELGWILNTYSSNGRLYFIIYSSNKQNPIQGKAVLFEITSEISETAQIGAELLLKPEYANTDQHSLNTEAKTLQLLQPLSDDSTLQSLTIKNYPFEFNFDSSIFEYQIDLPYEIAELDIDAVPRNEFAFIKISSVDLVPGKPKTIIIKVTAENGSTSEYVIIASRETDSSDIKSSECRISSVNPSAGVLSPEFNPDETEYTLSLPKGIYSVQFNCTTIDSNAKYEYYLNANKHYIIQCTAEDGTIMQYDITLAVDDTEISKPADPITENIAFYSAILASLLIIGFILGFVLHWRKK
ncbi:MAG: hypothetical protein A2Y17_08625 [Clostridiales bacterium GWF2_38_85]|nr:MAG: hypothetical protein A2Y17_08625 [Clostridiales bacterium GWF2_38_85]HBL83741.1 hypothetical protein [Clostridiales bacterium]